MMRVLCMLLLLVAVPTWASDDTQENRAKAAERYLTAASPKEMMADLAKKMAQNLPPDQQAAFKDLMTKHLDINALTKAMRKAMVKHFTAEELRALADFYGSPVGKSAMKKFGGYMADVMPSIQTEVMKAQAKANQELQDKKKD